MRRTRLEVTISAIANKSFRLLTPDSCYFLNRFKRGLAEIRIAVMSSVFERGQSSTVADATQSSGGLALYFLVFVGGEKFYEQRH